MVTVREFAFVSPRSPVQTGQRLPVLGGLGAAELLVVRSRPPQTSRCYGLFMPSAIPMMDAPLERLVRHVVEAMHPLVWLFGSRAEVEQGPQVTTISSS
jgi:hypothetical protein